jgi:phosphoribosyl 1,2-cyclic phosphodiesterase
VKLLREIELVFLGTGGGRFATITQKRRTGGIRILSENVNAHLDPGPGALIYSLNMNLNPQKISAILISHSHPDHYTDAEVLIEAMTHGTTKKRGTLAATRSVLSGNEVCEMSVSKYHQRMVERLIETKPGVEFGIGDLKVVACRAVHSDPNTVGFRFETADIGDFAYTSDTEYFEGIGKIYKGVRLLLLGVLRPSGKPWKGHMTTNEAIKIVEEVKPEMAVLTNFGMQMIFRGPDHEAKLVKEKTGVSTIAAKDEMRVSLGEKIQVGAFERRQPGLDRFMASKI